MNDDDARAADSTEIVATANSAAEATLIAGLLENHGIATIVRGDDAGAQVPSLDPLRGVKVLVASADAARARALIEGVEPLAEGVEPPQDGVEPDERGAGDEP